jgi:DNA-binding MarR family transcriptional regulator
VPRKDTKRGADIGGERAAASQPAADQAPVVTPEEKKVLDILLSSRTGRTVSQLSSRSGLPRDQVASALESLRAKGLVTRFNTLVESYAARFPGLEV